MVPLSVRSLVLLAPCGFGRQPIPEFLAHPLVRAFTQWLTPLTMTNAIGASSVYMTLVAPGRIPDSATLRRFLDASRNHADGVEAGTEAVVAGGRSKHAFYRRALAYSGPVSALWGEFDLLVPRSHAAGVKIAYPQAEVTVWPRMGHHPQAERASDLTRYIESALAR
jgi:pimeloyl-ACP methyl ester carboxylesterase